MTLGAPAILALALLLDAAAGEPEAIWRRLPHPAVLMGRLIGALDGRLNRGGHRRLKGVIALLILLTVAAGVGAAIAALPAQPLPQIVAAAILLAQKSLADHVRAVAAALEGAALEGAALEGAATASDPDERLAAGRATVAMIVGRDVAALDEAGIARAAIESAAENASDGVVAPAFWFLIGGLPGLAAYKALNTADSMIGYRTERHEAFGWAAARLDDIANLIPARLAAGLFALSALSFTPLRVAWRDARLHRSPNAGWPEAAMAAAIGVALAGPRVYHGQRTVDPFVYPEGRRDPGAAEIRRAVGALWRAWAALLGATLLIAVLTGFRPW